MPPPISPYNIGAAARNARAVQPDAPSSAASTGADFANMDMFTNATYRTQLEAYEQRGQRSPAESIAGLDEAIREALERTDIPVPPHEALIHHSARGAQTRTLSVEIDGQTFETRIPVRGRLSEEHYARLETLATLNLRYTEAGRGFPDYLRHEHQVLMFAASHGLAIESREGRYQVNGFERRIQYNVPSQPSGMSEADYEALCESLRRSNAHHHSRGSYPFTEADGAEARRLWDAAGHRHDPVPGSADWLEEGRRTGVFIRLPVPLAELQARIGDNPGQARAFLEAFSNQIGVINDYFRRAAANGASDMALTELYRAVTTPRGALNASSNDRDNDSGEFITTLSGDPMKVFGMVYARLSSNPGDMMDIIDDIAGNASNMGDMLGRAGVDILLEEARELELEVFEDTEQYKVDVNLAIMKYLEDLGGDMMGWTNEERRAFDAYVDVAREAALASRSSEGS